VSPVPLNLALDFARNSIPLPRVAGVNSPSAVSQGKLVLVSKARTTRAIGLAYLMRFGLRIGLNSIDAADRMLH